MLCIDSQSSNPYYNLAAEEIFLKNSDADLFMIWDSEPSIIVGKHQNALAEINYRFTVENRINVARRLTGGGTVYHDRGNINFTFIRNGEPGKLVDFSSFIDPVISFLANRGIAVRQGAKHEILASEKKFSGNAEHVHKNRVLHHGTILFNSDLGMLRKAIEHKGGEFSDKAVQSNRSHVVNLAGCLPENMEVRTFRRTLLNFVKDRFNGTLYEPDNSLKAEIQKLADEKYKSWDWIYGWSPDYSFSNEWTGEGIKVKIDLNVHRGTILNCMLDCSQADLSGAMKSLKGNRHSEINIREALMESGMERTLSSENFEGLVYAFF